MKPKFKVKVKLYWLIHHGILLESNTEPIANRIRYIKTNKPENERAIRLKWLRPVKRPELLPKAVVKADADWQKADADRKKAYADWKKAYADWQKADADWQKAYADRQKADADWQKAYADRQKADADWKKAYADRQKADADWKKTIGENWKNIVKRHKAECPGCPFDYDKKTLIFK